MCLAIPGQLIEVAAEDPLMPTGRVRFGGVIKEINLAYTPEAKVGDYVLVHVGFSLSIIDEQRAAETLDTLHSLAPVDDAPSASTGESR